MRYGDDYPEISFFETLGALQGDRLSFWYAGPDGKRSKSSAQILGNQDEWRTGYWKGYHAGRVTKTRDWAHESEHRLVLGSSISQPRILKCHFKDLAGICFGIKTSAEDKLRVMRKVRTHLTEAQLSRAEADHLQRVPQFIRQAPEDAPQK